MNIGSAEPGKKITLTFPILERTVKEKFGAGNYTLVMRGNTVVQIDPAGVNWPLNHGREKYRTTQVAWKNAQRFVSDETIEW